MMKSKKYTQTQSRDRDTKYEIRGKNEDRNSKLVTRNSCILGIDPGYGRIGIAIIENEGGKQKLIHSECFETDSKLEHPNRLALIADKICNIVDKFTPGKAAVEDLLFSKNVKTAIKVAEARGTILSEIARAGIPVFEYNPNSIKLAVTGYGKADKKQIIDMVGKLLKIDHAIKYDDEYDAIAVALTCAVTNYPHL